MIIKQHSTWCLYNLPNMCYQKDEDARHIRWALDLNFFSVHITAPGYYSHLNNMYFYWLSTIESTRRALSEQLKKVDIFHDHYT